MTISVRALSVLAALVAVGVTGCAPEDSVAEPTSSPPSSTTATPTPTSTPVPGFLVLDADSFSVTTADGVEIDSYTFLEDPADIVAALTAVFAVEPTVTSSPGDDVCDPATTVYAWDSTLLVVADDNFAPTYGLVSNASDEGGSVRVETAAGGRVGGSFDDHLAQIPGMPHVSFDNDGERLEFALESLSSFEADDRPDTDRLGVRIVGVDGVIDFISSPSLLNNPC